MSIAKNKVLVTGAGGFMGSHLTELLIERRYRVKALVRYNARNHWGWLEDLPHRKEVEVVAGDIRDYVLVREALRECSSVFHLAALVSIPYSYGTPLEYLKTNLEGSYNVLQASLSRKLDQVVFVSTSEVYGTAQYVPMDERHPMNAQSPYAASKIAAEQLAASYFHSYGLPVKILRPFNTYGPRQSARAVVTAIIIQLLSGRKKIRLGNLHPTRDLTFVRDSVKAFLALAESGEGCGEFTNIGTGREISVADLAARIAALLDTEIQVAKDRDRRRPDSSEVERLLCDNRKLVSRTGWKPDYTLEEGLGETIRWIEFNLKLYKSGIYNI